MERLWEISVGIVEDRVGAMRVDHSVHDEEFAIFSCECRHL